MKKVKFFIAAFGVLLLTTGCGTEELVCTIEDNDLGAEGKYVLTFKSDELETADFTSVFDMGIEFSDEDLEGLCAEVDVEGVECEAKSDGTEITLELEIDATKLSDEELKELDFENTTYDKVKKDLEDQDYKCE